MRKILSKEIMTNVALGGAATVLSPWIPVDSFQNWGIQMNIVGVSTNTFVVQYSTDLVPTSDGRQSTYLIDGTLYPRFFDLQATPAPANTGVTTILSPPVTPATWIRLSITNVTGASSVTAVLCAKGFI